MTPRVWILALLLLASGCSSSSASSQSDAGGNDASRQNDASSMGTLGADCPCTTSVCSMPGPMNGCAAGLSCVGPFVSAGMLVGRCASRCTCDTGICDAGSADGGGQCTAGFSCSDLTVYTTDLGPWCLQ